MHSCTQRMSNRFQFQWFLTYWFYFYITCVSFLYLILTNCNELEYSKGISAVKCHTSCYVISSVTSMQTAVGSQCKLSDVLVQFKITGYYFRMLSLHIGSAGSRYTTHTHWTSKTKSLLYKNTKKLQNWIFHLIWYLWYIRKPQ